MWEGETFYAKGSLFENPDIKSATEHSQHHYCWGWLEHIELQRVELERQIGFRWIWALKSILGILSFILRIMGSHWRILNWEWSILICASGKLHWLQYGGLQKVVAKLMERSNSHSVVGWKKVKDSTNSCKYIKSRDLLDMKFQRVIIVENYAHISDLGILVDDNSNY